MRPAEVETEKTILKELCRGYHNHISRPLWNELLPPSSAESQAIFVESPANAPALSQPSSAPRASVGRQPAGFIVMIEWHSNSSPNDRTAAIPFSGKPAARSDVLEQDEEIKSYTWTAES